MERSTAILADHPINLARMGRGDLPATQIWLFWPGMQPGAMPSFASVFGRRAVMSTAVDLLRGLAKQVAMDTIELPGVTDTNDNDWPARCQVRLRLLSTMTP